MQWLNAEDQWEPQELSPTMPGFRIYLISLLLCQHFYLVANARERQLPLARVDGELIVTTGENWILKSVIGSFRLQLDQDTSGAQQQSVTDADLDAELNDIQKRMKACPVSRNLPESVEKITSLRLA